MRHPHLFGAACVLLLAGSGAAQAGVASFIAALNGANVVGGGDPTATGLAKVTIDYEANYLEYEISFTRLGNGRGTLVAEHFHRGAVGTNGPAIFSLNVSNLTGHGSFKGGFTNYPAALLITPATASNYYIDLHSDGFPSGAIRGQLQAVPEPQALVLMLAGVGIAGWAVQRRQLR